MGHASLKKSSDMVFLCGLSKVSPKNLRGGPLYLPVCHEKTKLELNLLLQFNFWTIWRPGDCIIFLENLGELEPVWKRKTETETETETDRERHRETETEREIERDRERQRQRERDRQTDRQRQREREREGGRGRGRERGWWGEGEGDGEGIRE